MPKDEIDPTDPMEFTAVTLLTDEDTMTPMGEAFTEEFMRMGYNAKQILALFQNEFYTGPHMVWKAKGEEFVRKLIADTFAKWGRKVEGQ
jgi:hypothetical protein